MPEKRRGARTRPCPSCGRRFRRGAIVLRILPSGAVRERVCKTCADAAVRVLASDAAARCNQCGTNVAAFCRGCVAKLLNGTPAKLVKAAAEVAKRRRPVTPEPEPHPFDPGAPK